MREKKIMIWTKGMRWEDYEKRGEYSMRWDEKSIRKDENIVWDKMRKVSEEYKKMVIE